MNVGQSPPILFDRALRRQRAARAAATFQQHDFLHDHATMLAAERLMDVARGFDRGCIWGDRGRQLLPKLAEGKIKTVIFADSVPMMGQSVIADAEQSPFAEGAFDVVVSLLDLHAANDPVGLIVQARQSLAPDGLFIGVMFGANTLRELRSALGEAEIEVTGGLSPRVFPFADVRDAGGLLQRAGLALPVADTDSLVVEYSNVQRLLHDLRGCGETSVLSGRRRSFLRRGILSKTLELYESAHGEAEGPYPATFNFVTLTGWAPHDSQQKPLKPGSGQISLTDVFESRRAAGV